MKNFIRQTIRAIIGLTLLVLVIMVSVTSYEFLRVKLSAPYDAETMMLNYEVTGSGEKNLLLIHGLAGYENYWKRGLGNIGGTHKLFMVDLLGFGDSPKPQSNYSLDVQVGALEKLL